MDDLLRRPSIMYFSLDLPNSIILYMDIRAKRQQQFGLFNRVFTPIKELWAL